MNNDYVLIGKEAKEKLIEGVNLITDAIECTYGPNASNVCIKTPYNVQVTKDGKTVAESVHSTDKYIQAGIDLIKEVSKKTANEVGDGSSTVAILTRALIQNYQDYDNTIELCRTLRQECEDVIKFLKSNSKEIFDSTTLEKVATLSANNDTHIGSIIAEAYSKVGSDGLVTFQKGESVKDRVEYSKGFQIENGFFSPYLINTKEGTAELNNVYVYISQTKLDNAKKVQEIWQQAINEGKSLLLMAPDFDSSITMLIYKNMFREGSSMSAGMVISPNFGAMREVATEDIKTILGETLTCEKVIMTKDTTTFIGYNSASTINDRIAEVKDILSQELSEIDRDFHRKRLASLTGGFATIYVGGYSETEVQTRCDLYEDAIAATACALHGGILPGGGASLNKASYNTIFLKKTLQTPFLLLNASNFIADSIKLKDFWYTVDARNGVHGEAEELGIIEPFLVVKATLENAISAATNILTTNCLIVNDL